MQRTKSVHLRWDEATTMGKESEKTYYTAGFYMYIHVCVPARFLSQLARHSVGLVLVVSVPHGRLMPQGLA